MKVSVRALNCDMAVVSDDCGRSDGQVARRAGRVARATRSERGIAGFRGCAAFHRVVRGTPTAVVGAIRKSALHPAEAAGFQKLFTCSHLLPLGTAVSK
jgi:hypothetical protein